MRVARKRDAQRTTGLGAPRFRSAGVEPSHDYPGRWLGGAVGALTSFAAAIVLHLVDARVSGTLSMDLTGIALLGIPIGFVLGRQFFPSVRSEPWRVVLTFGLLLGWMAPPLGAIEVLAGPALLPGAAGEPAPLQYLWLLPIAIPFSFVAVFVTMPVGVAWAVTLRLVPERLVRRSRMPGPIERLGVRHALVALVAWGVVVQAHPVWR